MKTYQTVDRAKLLTSMSLAMALGTLFELIGNFFPSETELTFRMANTWYFPSSSLLDLFQTIALLGIWKRKKVAVVSFFVILATQLLFVIYHQSFSGYGETNIIFIVLFFVVGVLSFLLIRSQWQFFE